MPSPLRHRGHVLCDLADMTQFTKVHLISARLLLRRLELCVAFELRFKMRGFTVLLTMILNDETTRLIGLNYREDLPRAIVVARTGRPCEAATDVDRFFPPLELDVRSVLTGCQAIVTGDRCLCEVATRLQTSHFENMIVTFHGTGLAPTLG
jgi:hypothetical protein